jgi:hypothetical protein
MRFDVPPSGVAVLFEATVQVDEYTVPPDVMVVSVPIERRYPV